MLDHTSGKRWHLFIVHLNIDARRRPIECALSAQLPQRLVAMARTNTNCGNCHLQSRALGFVETKITNFKLPTINGVRTFTSLVTTQRDHIHWDSKCAQFGFVALKCCTRSRVTIRILVDKLLTNLFQRERLSALNEQGQQVNHALGLRCLCSHACNIRCFIGV